MTRVRLALLVLPLVLLAACGGPQVPAAQNYGTIAGRVYDAATNAAVAGAVVTVDTILVATSAADGAYRIGNIPLGTYHIDVRPPQGYAAASQPSYDGSIQSGQTIAVDVPLTKP